MVVVVVLGPDGCFGFDFELVGPLVAASVERARQATR